MDQTLFQFETSAAFGLHWPTWLAVGGVTVFCLLGLYAGFLFFAEQRLVARFRFVLPPTLRGRILLGIILASTLPAISLALVLTERTTNEKLNQTAELLASRTTSTAKIADYFLYMYSSELLTSAASIKLNNQDQAEASLHKIQSELPYSHSLQVIDKNGLTIAATQFGTKSLASLPADTDYVREPLKTGKIFFSDAIPHPADAATTSVAISIPITGNQGEVSGLLIAYYNLSHFDRIKQPLMEKSNIEPLLLDRSGQVLYVNKLANTVVGQNLSGQSLLTNPYAGDAKVFNFLHASSPDGPPKRYLATGYTLRDGWRIYLTWPLESMETVMLSEYGVAMAWLGGALIISICLALAMVAGVSDPLESLDRSVREFDLSKTQKQPDPPASAPQEVRSIFQHLGELDKRMRATYSKLRKALAQGEKLRGELIYVISNREKEIEARTQELKEANETLERLSREDSLTGLANRRWFAQFLAQAWRTALRDNKAISILIMDIDDFKAYNDQYGHQKGDECLKHVADAIRSAVGRASDLVSRYGGEEFVVVLGDTPLEGALRIAEQIRAAVEALKIPHKASKYQRHITLSIGVTSTLPTHDSQPETVLIAADRAMYNAKHEGKNRVAYSTAARTGTYQSLVVSNDAPTRLS